MEGVRCLFTNFIFLLIFFLERQDDAWDVHRSVLVALDHGQRVLEPLLSSCDRCQANESRYRLARRGYHSFTACTVILHTPSLPHHDN
jgi:hypothetical protein